MPIRNKLSIIIILALFSILVVSCAQPLINTSLFKQNGKNPEKIFQSASEDEGLGTNGSEFQGTTGEEDKEYLTCFTENPQPVAQDIADKFETSYEMVEDWYCQGHSFEDIMLALMTSRLWEIDPDQVFLAHETQTWDEIWEELDNSQ